MLPSLKQRKSNRWDFWDDISYPKVDIQSLHSKFTFKELVVDFSLTKIKGVSTIFISTLQLFLIYFPCESKLNQLINP